MKCFVKWSINIPTISSQAYCDPCFWNNFAPKCCRCSLPIKEKMVSNQVVFYANCQMRVTRLVVSAKTITLTTLLAVVVALLSSERFAFGMVYL